jgi:glycosyltransferase involved in cell wall biosynthesis
MNQPTFTVIIPTFNRATFIKQTIESVLAQTLDDFEVIVVDDGSTDHTATIVNTIDDGRIRYHFKKNEERGVARNTGTKLSTGRYINFFDSDDLLHPQHLSVALDMIEKFDEPEFFHLGYEVREGPNGPSRRLPDLPKVANEKLINGNYLSCNGVFLRRDVAEAYPFRHERELSGTEDYELWLRLASRFPLHCDQRITSILVNHAERSVVNTDTRKLVRRIELLEKYLIDDPEFRKAYGSQMGVFKANNRVYIALHVALSKTNRLEALKYLWKALHCSLGGALRARAFYGTVKRLYL